MLVLVVLVGEKTIEGAVVAVVGGLVILVIVSATIEAGIFSVEDFSDLTSFCSLIAWNKGCSSAKLRGSS